MNQTSWADAAPAPGAVQDKRAAERDVLAQLYELNERLCNAASLTAILQEILAVAVAGTHADKGAIQILSAAGGQLELVVQQGCEPALVNHFKSAAGALSVAVLHAGARVVIEDLADAPLLAPTPEREILLGDGVRALQITPLISRAGRMVGLLSTSYSQPYRLPESELRLLDLLARMAADFIESAQDKKSISAVLDSLAPSVALLDREGVIINVNEAWKQFARANGYDEASYGVGVNYLEVVRQAIAAGKLELQPILSGLAAVLERSLPQFEFEYPCHSAEQQWWFILNVSPLDLRQGGVVISHTDITTRKQAESALRTSEEKYRTLFNSIDEGFGLIEVLFAEDGVPQDYVYLEVNQAFEQQSGLRQVVGRRLRELLPEVEERWLQLCGTVVRTGQPQQLTRYSQSLQRWFDFFVFRFGAEASHKAGILFRNVTERQQAEERVRRAAEFNSFRVTLTDALRRLTDPAAIQSLAVRSLGAQLKASRCSYGEAQADGVSFLIQHDYRDGAPSSVEPQPLSDFASALIVDLQAGRRLVVADTQNSPQLTETQRAAAAALGLRAFVAIPLLKDGRFVAVLSLNQAAPREWAADEIELIEETAERTWAAVERARAEAALRDAEERLQMAIQAGAMCWWEVDLATGQFSFSENVRQVLREESLPATLTDGLALLSSDDGARLAESLARSAAEARPFTEEICYTNTRGETLWLEIQGRSVKDATGQAVRVVGVALDITPHKQIGVALQRVHDELETRVQQRTAALAQANSALLVEVAERKRAEKALRQQDEQLRLSLEASSAGCWWWDMTTNRANWDDRYHELYGYAPDAPRAFETWLASVHPADREASQRRLRELVADHASSLWNEEFRVLHPRQGERWMLGLGRAERDAAGRIVRLAGINLDITERKQTEAALQRANEELAQANAVLQAKEIERRELLRRLVAAQEEERRRLSLELHDQTGQHFAALRIMLAMLQEPLQPHPAQLKLLLEIQAIAERLAEETHALARELRPTGLQELGLAGALAQYVEEWSARSLIAADFYCQGKQQAASALIEITLYRVVQEALTNVLKHAQARNVSVLLEYSADRLRAVIEDDGKGFAPEQVLAFNTGAARLGLHGMRERLALVDGQLEIEATPGGGTTLYVTLPLASDAQQEGLV